MVIQKEKSCNWQGIIWDCGYDIKKRKTKILIWGKFLDFFWPIHVNHRTPSFYAIKKDGSVMQGKDGVNWKPLDQKEINNYENQKT